MRRLFELLTRPALVPIWVLAIAALVLLPDLSRPGLWEPHELSVADGAVARNEQAARPPAPATTPPAPLFWTRFAAYKGPRCATTPPADPDGGARTLGPALAAAGLRISDSDGGMRLPGALLGILCLLATTGIALRLGGGRAGLIAGLACLSFPIFVLDARMVDGDIGTPAAAALIVYAAVALAAPRRGTWLASDLIVSVVALGLGAWLGFRAGGALLGLLVPLGAVAAADGLGLGLPRAIRSERGALGRGLVGLIAFAGACALVILVAHQIYDWVQPVPGEREIFGHTVMVSDCWSDAIGGLWKVDDDVRMGVDSVFEQIAFGTFPVGVLAPIALFALATGAAGDARRPAGRIALAWAGAAWIATQVWHRKVGFALWPGFPALAVGIGVWIDSLFAAREHADAEDVGADLAMPLVAMFVVAATITIAVDVWAFPDRITSLLVGGDVIKYPPHARLAHLPLRLWVGVMGGLFAVLFGAGVWLWQPARFRRIARRALPASIAWMLVLALFWVFGWHDGLARHLSSKHVFSVYRDLRKDGDTLGIMGDMGNAPRYYAGGPWETIPGRDPLLAFLARPKRVFALVPSSELCAIHRAAAGKPYFVLDDSNPRTLLLTNQLDGERDLNSLRTTVLRTPPPHMKKKPPAPIVYDDKIELIGWDVPDEASFGSSVKVTLYFHVKGKIDGAWKIFEHFDPPSGQRFQGDHDPIHGTCATSFWQPDDYIVDENDVDTGGVGLGAGAYELWVGFFTGSNPNWTNMKVTAAPKGWQDNAQRVHIGTVVLD